MRQRLIAREYAPEEVDAALDRLVEAGLQCDQRWAESLARRRRTQGCGPLRISAELRAKVGPQPQDEGLLGSALEEAGPANDSQGDFARALALLARRFAGADLRDAKQRARALRLLVSRGYPAALAIGALAQHARAVAGEAEGARESRVEPGDE